MPARNPFNGVSALSSGSTMSSPNVAMAWMTGGTLRQPSSRQRVDGAGDRRRQLLAVDEPGVLQLAQPVGQQVGGDAGQLGAQVTVAAGAADELAQDQQRPSLAEDVQAEGDGAVLLVTPLGWHGNNSTTQTSIKSYHLKILSEKFTVMSMSTRTPVFKDHPIAALAVICLSVFVVSVDATIVNVALPTLSRELDADTAQLQWIVDAYTLVMAGLMLSAGSLADRFGRRGFLSGGLVLFALTSTVAAQVSTADGLIWARAAMGVGAAVIFPATLALITNIFTQPAQRAKAIGLWAAMVGVGVAVGPISGGWLLEHFSWGSIFLVNLPIAAVAVIGGWLFIPTSRDPATPPIDVVGLILSAVGVTALVYTIIEAPNHGWTSGHTIAGFAVAAVVIAAFIWWEQRRTHPMLDLSVFRNRRFSGGSLAITAGFLTLFGFIFVITQYFQFIKGYSAFETGVRLLPVAASIAIASIRRTAHCRTDRHHRGGGRGAGDLRRRSGLGVHRAARALPTWRSRSRWCCSAPALA